jgi:hypothetical protein
MAGEAFRNWLEDTEAEDAVLTPLLTLVFATAMASGAKKALSKSLEKQRGSGAKLPPEARGLKLERRWVYDPRLGAVYRGYWVAPKGIDAPHKVAEACAEAAAEWLERSGSYYEQRAKVYEKPEAQELTGTVLQALERGEKTIEGKAISTYVKEKLEELGLEKYERPTFRARFHGAALYGMLMTAARVGISGGVAEAFGALQNLEEEHARQAGYIDRVESRYKAIDELAKRLRASGAAKNMAVAEALAARQLLKEYPHLFRGLSSMRMDLAYAGDLGKAIYLNSLGVLVTVAEAIKTRLTGVSFSEELWTALARYIEAWGEKHRWSFDRVNFDIIELEASAKAIDRLERRQPGIARDLTAKLLQDEAEKVFAGSEDAEYYGVDTLSELREKIQKGLDKARRQCDAAYVDFMAKFIEEFTHGTLYSRTPEGRRRAKKLASLYRDVAAKHLEAADRVEALREQVRALKAEGKDTSAVEAEMKKEQVKREVWGKIVDVISACALAPLLDIPAPRVLGRSLVEKATKAISEIESVKDWSKVSAWHLLEAPTGALADILSHLKMPSFRERAKIIRGLIDRYPQITEEVAKFLADAELSKKKKSPRHELAKAYKEMAKFMRTGRVTRGLRRAAFALIGNLSVI